MSVPRSSPIPIAGGGIAGLTVALCLAQRGLHAHICEKADAFQEVGAGIQLSPNAMQVLKALGLEPALRAHAVAPDQIHLKDGRHDSLLAALPLGGLAVERFGALYWVIHRADLQKVLVEACKATDQITITLGHEVAPDPELALVIAADGVHSSWRAMLRHSSHKQFTGYVAWRTTVALDAAETRPVTKLWFGPKAHLVDYPISAGRARNVVAIARTGDPAPMLDDPRGQLKTAFAAWHPALRARLEAENDWTPWPLFGVTPSAPWVSDRIALIGDAAHAMLPFIAQGGAMAIEDAAVLASEIAGAVDGGRDVAVALARYEQARKPRVTRVWKEAARNGRAYHLTGPLALARNAVIRTRSGQGWLTGYDWLYGWQPPA